MGIFSNDVIKEVGIGEWDFAWHFTEKDLKKSYLEVKSTNGEFQIRIPANSHVYGYLLEAANQELLDQLHGWITMVYCVAMLTTQDQGLTDGIQKEIGKWHKRMLKKAETEAKATTDEQIQADEALINDMLYEQTLTKEQLKEKRISDKEIMLEILKEKE